MPDHDYHFSINQVRCGEVTIKIPVVTADIMREIAKWAEEQAILIDNLQK